MPGDTILTDIFRDIIRGPTRQDGVRVILRDIQDKEADNTAQIALSGCSSGSQHSGRCRTSLIRRT